MSLNCLNNIITDNLAIEIDLTNNNSWDLSTGLTTYSLTKWSGAKSDNLNLIDFGLTGFDTGRINQMWSGISYTPNNTLFSMYKVGYNIIDNPTSGETTGITINTNYLPISGVTDVSSGNYFELAGGYLQGFFKLDGYNYELLPSRFNEGITIETLLYLYPDSEGIFYMMGARAEDKYSPYFSGETTINGNTASGVVTSEDNHLDAISENKVLKDSFRKYEDRFKIDLKETTQSTNTANNVIAFEITTDKKIAYKYIDENNQIVYNKSKKSINPSTGWTTISMSFIPNERIEDLDLLDCYAQRKGKFIIYVNGRSLWIIDNYSEFFFKAFQNDPEKQIGVPYSISWGGGSFGLKYSWHYDIQTYGLYTNQNQTFIDENFIVESDPFEEQISIDGLSLSADSSTFKQIDDNGIEQPVTVLRVDHTGTTAQTYFIKYDQPISILSNREYEINLKLYVDGFFKTYDPNNYFVDNNVSIVVYGTEDIDILYEDNYKYPLTSDDIENLPNVERYPLPDDQEYSYVYQGVSLYGISGLPVYDDLDYYTFYGTDPLTGEKINDGGVFTGENKWIPLKTRFNVKDNTGKQQIYVGILIETSYEFNSDRPLFINDFKYTGADILSQDSRKNNLLIEQNFDSSFNGKIQKLRIYDKGLTSQEILHNALIEMNKNPNLNLKISKGGRIIYR